MLYIHTFRHAYVHTYAGITTYMRTLIVTLTQRKNRREDNLLIPDSRNVTSVCLRHSTDQDNGKQSAETEGEIGARDVNMKAEN